MKIVQNFADKAVREPAESVRLMPWTSPFLPPSIARYAQGVDRSICLGGGGIFFVAWQVGYLTALMDAGINVRGAKRVVGTSAGSMVATVLARDGLRRLHAELDAMTRFPQLAAHMSASGGMHPSQARAWSVFETTSTNDPEQLRRLSHAALAAQTVEPATMHRNVELIAGVWATGPASRSRRHLHRHLYRRAMCDRSSCCGVSSRSDGGKHRPAGHVPSATGRGRKCMDGGVGATAVHMDLMAGSLRSLVLSLRGFEPTGTTKQDAADLQALQDSGTSAFTAVPESFTDKQMMRFRFDSHGPRYG